MYQLSIDIETFSSVPIAKAGMYKYVQSSDFEVLLIAYSLDRAPVEIVDLTAGEFLPSAVQVALTDPNCIKHAYNAPFEWYALSKYFEFTEQQALAWLPQWRCTMLHGLYCGYTAGLDATGKALGLPADKQKLATGKALIRTFCCPVKPTKSNGNRTRILPHHEPEKWELFKEYCRQDVVTEREIERRLSSFPVPDLVQAEWVSDQTINARGVAMDTGLIDGAMSCSAQVTRELTAESRGLTGLDNPNSLQQLTGWLSQQGIDVDTLRKEDVTDLLSCALPEEVRRVLEIRQELGKTSVKKYQAMEDALCADQRVRGLLQFYGANRTGRWAGRLVQVQNLPRTNLHGGMLDLARDLTREKKPHHLRLIYGSVPDTLSQLVRTAFVPKDGCLFVDADFSAIEARVIAWLAGEDWVLNVFRTHGKIYEATASQMFGVPLERIAKGNPEYELRQKGKVATLALGYQGGVGALATMGALRMGLSEDELPDIVTRWRSANPAIVRCWHACEKAAIQAIETGRPVGVRGLLFAREADVQHGQDFLTVLLPSGRKLFYAKPHLGLNQWGGKSIHYYGMNQTTKKWETTDTYGGKLTENIVQAIARDCLAINIERLEQAGYPVTFHVHDEVVLETEKDRANLDAVVEIMSQPIDWAPGLPLNADGWVGGYFTKD